MTVPSHAAFPKKSMIRAIRAISTAWVGALTLVAWPCAALAADPQPPQQTRRAGPPPQAIAACGSLSAGQACSFDDQSRKVSGSCWAPEGKPLACRPSGGTGQRRNATPGPAL